MSLTTQSKSKTRKQRIINNAIVNVDDVSIECGPKYINWVKIAKQKLIQRELKLLHKRQLIVDRIVMNVIHSFVERNMDRRNFNQCLVIYQQEIRHQLMSETSPIMMRCAQDIAATLNKWRGPKTDEEILLFRGYFQLCRHWFDTTKITIMTNDFWIPIMQLIHEYATKSTDHFFGHQSECVYSDYLYILIIKSLFEGQMKPSNARNMWLVPAMSYPKILRKHNQNLQIILRRPTNSNKAVRKQYLECLNNKFNNLREAFDNTMYEYFVLMNASHSSSSDNYNVCNRHLKPPLAQEEKYSLQTNHNNNINANEMLLRQISSSSSTMQQIHDDANANGYNDASCLEMNHAQYQRIDNKSALQPLCLPQITAIHNYNPGNNNMSLYTESLTSYGNQPAFARSYNINSKCCNNVFILFV